MRPRRFLPIFAVRAMASAVILAAVGSASLAEAATRCLLPKSHRAADVTTNAGRVEIFDELVRIDGVRHDACGDLPAPHPVAAAPFRDGVAIAFRDGELALWRGGAFETLTPAGSPIRSLAGAGDTLWIGTTSKGLLRLDGAGLKEVTGTLPSSVRRTPVAALAVDERGALHVADGAGAHWMSPAAALAPRTAADTAPWQRVPSKVPVGCFRRGGLEAYPPGPSCRDDEEVGELPSGHVTALTVQGDHLVVGTFDGGAFRVDGDGHTRMLEGAPRHVNALLVADGALFAGGPRGLYAAVHEGPLAAVNLGVPPPHVNALAPSKGGALWMATSVGALRWDGHGTRVVDEGQGLPSPLAYAVAETDDGALWVGTARGAARVPAGAGERAEIFDLEGGALPQDWVTALATDGPSVWAGTYSRGVVRLTPGGAHVEIEAFRDRWINPQGLVAMEGTVVATTLGDHLVFGDGRVCRKLPSNDVTAVVLHQGALWIGTRSGIARMDAKDAIGCAKNGT